MKKRKKEKKFKLRYIFFIILILSVFLIILVPYLLLSKFKIGDFVFKQDPEVMIGEIKGISFSNYLVQWQDSSLTEESSFNIKKLSELKEEEIEDTLEKNNPEKFDIYSKDEKGLRAITLPGEGTGSSSSGSGTTGAGTVPGQGFGNATVKVGKSGCEEKFICSKWSECQVEHDIYTLITEQLSHGLQYRYCEDYAECMPDFYDSRACKKETPIIIKKVESEGEDLIEIYTLDNKLISRLNKKQIENFDKLYIEIVI